LAQRLHRAAVASTSSRTVRYGSALGSVALALIASLLARPLIEPNPFLLFFAAVALSSWVGGMGPGLLAIMLAALICDYLFLPPVNAVSLDSISLARLSGFMFVALIICGLSAARRRAVAALEAERARLVDRVEERTGDLQLVNANLTRALEVKDRFLSSMSHELRTPLNAIIGFTGTLLMKLPGPLTTDQERQLRTIRHSAEHLLTLINDMLDLAKIESGKVELRLEPVVCQVAIEEVITTLRTLADAKGITLEATMPPQELVLSTDRRALSQILLNLTNNAIKFTEQGSVRLTLSQHPQQGRRVTEISVVDTGIGIDPDEQTKLFQLFTQVDDAHQHRQKGSGLGLHLSQKLAGLLGGQITVQSTAGQGSTFTVHLPEA
jgi:two-component system, sensor histidine kinase and response regulator